MATTSNLLTSIEKPTSVYQPPKLPTELPGADAFKAAPKKKATVGEKFSNGMLGQNFEGINKALDFGSSITNSLPGAQNTYDGIKGDTRKAIDEGWNAVSDIASNFGPYGLMVSMGMKAANMLNGILGAIFGATDGMTTTDAILDSPLGMMIPGLGLVNQAFGKTSDTITKNEEAFALTGSAYGGTSAAVDNALTFSGKKYGAFSSAARKDANALIAETRRQQTLVEDIASEATTRMDLAGSMSGINSNRRALAMNGGYNQSSIRVGKNGFSLKLIMTAKRVVSALRFQPKPVEQSQPEVVDSFQQGGVLELSLLDISEEYLEPMSTIEEVTLDSILPEFREGGKVNVIPEGALHARLHHMENAENLTKKGIPVVSEKDGGELELLAEIEREEIIFRLEVTKKLEELLKNYSDEESSLKDRDTAVIEAGKLLVEEILNNTIDNTGLLTNIN